MSFAIEASAIPLATNADGVVQVGGSRVPLETVVSSFQEGATPEEIVQQYPALDLADVYSVIGYYLHNYTAVDAYMQERQQEAATIRHQNEGRFDGRDLRDRKISKKRP
jgi:uncharacterized protein (DUF433 family)